MKADIVLAGVGGQGVLSVAAILAEAARRDGLWIKQAEVHGMAQRGGAVQAMLRLADEPVASELIPHGAADLILGMEPVEALRYVGYLTPDGAVVTAAEPFRNIADYPSLDEVYDRLRALPNAAIIEAGRLAKEAGSLRAANMVMVGAGSRLVPVAEPTLEGCIEDWFAAKGQRLVAVNLRAFRAGRDAVTPSRS